MKVWIADVLFDDVTMAEAVTRVAHMARQRDRPRYVCPGNLDHLALLRRDQRFGEIYRRADLVLADGMPIVWLSRLARGGSLRERVAGSDLFWELARLSADTGLKLFFLGGAPGAAERAAAAARARYPGVQICGIYCPSFEEFGSDAEEARPADAIRRAAPDILLVALGAPKQEKWIAAHQTQLGVPVAIGVGGSFEMAGGLIHRAPLWMQRAGMEWLHRLAREPGRLWRRYLVRDLPLFFGLIAQTVLSRWSPSR